MRDPGFSKAASQELSSSYKAQLVKDKGHFYNTAPDRSREGATPVRYKEQICG